MATVAMAIRIDGSQPILSRVFWSYPPAPIIMGTTDVAIGVMRELMDPM